MIITFTPEMERLVLMGRKLCTTRLTQKGEAGDWLALRGQIYRVLDVRKYPLKFIAANLYRLEGFDTSEEFIAYWDTLPEYPKYADAMDETFFVHFFAYAKGTRHPKAANHYVAFRKGGKAETANELPE